jgi:hypothetical protein
MLMTLGNNLLEKLSEWQPPTGRNDLVVGDTDAGWTVTVTAERSDALGCLLWDLTLRRIGGVTDLTGWANRLAECASGLLEPLKVIEVDTERRQAQLRSEAPFQRGDKRFYYEVALIGDGSASLRRFQAATTSARREQVAFALTHEALAKLVEDVLASA